MTQPKDGGGRSQTTRLSSQHLGGRVKILLADDSLTMHRAVGLGLRAKPYELITCDNGQDALRLALEHHPAIVLADLDMPGLSGLEVLKAVRAEDSLKATKVVLLCSSFDEIDESRIEEASPDGRLWKPFESHALIALIETLLKAPFRESSEATSTELNPSNAEQDEDLARDLTAETFRTASHSDDAETGREGRKDKASRSEKAQAQQKSQEAPRSRPRRSAEPTEILSPGSESTNSGVEKTQESLERPDVSAQSAQSHKVFEKAIEDDSLISEETGPIDAHQARQNLWDDAYAPEATEESLGASETSELFSSSGSSQAEEEFEVEVPSQVSKGNFEIVTSSLDIDGNELPVSTTASLQKDQGLEENQEADFQAEVDPTGDPTAELPQDVQAEPERWSQDIDFSEYQQDEALAPQRAPSKSSGLSEAQVRAMVREEVKEVFDNWLRKALEEQLEKVLKQIDAADSKG